MTAFGSCQVTYCFHCSGWLAFDKTDFGSSCTALAAIASGSATLPCGSAMFGLCYLTNSDSQRPGGSSFAQKPLRSIGIQMTLAGTSFMACFEAARYRSFPFCWFFPCY